MPVYVSTTGTLSPVIIRSLGRLELEHPTVDLNLELQFPRDTIFGNEELQQAVTDGYLTFAKQENNESPIGDISDPESAESSKFISSKNITLTGDSSLNVNDPSFLFIDPSDSDRNYDLPSASAAAGRQYWIFFKGNSKRKIEIRDDGVKIYDLKRNRAVLIASDGSEWYLLAINSTNTAV